MIPGASMSKGECSSFSAAASTPEHQSQQKTNKSCHIKSVALQDMSEMSKPLQQQVAQTASHSNDSEKNDQWPWRNAVQCNASELQDLQCLKHLQAMLQSPQLFRLGKTLYKSLVGLILACLHDRPVHWAHHFPAPVQSNLLSKGMSWENNLATASVSRGLTVCRQTEISQNGSHYIAATQIFTTIYKSLLCSRHSNS